MIELLVHYDDNHNKATANPSEPEIISAINSLDGIDILMVMLSSLEGYMFVHSSIEKRMHVSYSRNNEFAYLVEKNELKNQILKFPLGNGDIDEWSMHETVSPEIALKIALYFFRNQAFPKGLDWEGRTQYLPIIS